MRALGKTELSEIAGGMRMMGKTPLGGSHYSAVHPDETGYGGGGTGGGSGDSVTQQELVNGLQAVISMAEAGTLGSATTGALFSAVDFSRLTVTEMQANVSDAEAECQEYEHSLDIADELPPGDQSGNAEILPWDNIDFSYYSDGGRLSCAQAVENVFQDLQNHQPLHINPYSADLKSNGAHGTVGEVDYPVYGWGVGDFTELWVSNDGSLPSGSVTVGELQQVSSSAGSYFELFLDDLL